MIAFILRRLIQSVIVMIAVAFISFLLFQYVGDPVSFLLGQDATPEEVREMRAALGLDQPFFVQFWHFLGNAVQGDFGMSLRQAAKVSGLIAERFPATLELALVAAVLALVVGIPMGVYTALRRGSFMSQVFMAISLLGVSLPTFLIGILLILVFAVGLGWFPSFGRGDTVQLGWWSTGLLTLDGWHHIVLPAITLAIFQLTLIMRLVRAEMLEVLRTDYIKFARARGLSNRAIHFGHALKNTLVPVMTITGLLTRDGWHHIVLPAITLAIFQLTLIMRLVRAEMLEVLRTDYIKFARARGLSNRAIHFGHALKNTLVPVMTITGLQLGGLIAFAIITESVFQWPGMGLLFIQAVTFADIPVMAAYLCLVALIFVVINLVVDLLYFVVDPRLRVGKSGGH